MQLRLLKCSAGLSILVLTVAACSQKPGSEAPAMDAALETSMVAGKAVYDQYCLTCHLASGKGAPPMNPPLAGTSFVVGDKAVLIGIVLNGMSGTPVDGVTYKNIMPGFAFLTDDEIANLLTYIRNSFGNHAGGVSPVEVAQTRPTK